MNNESRFWRDTILSKLHPGWQLELGSQSVPGSIDLAQHTAAIYLVDTSSDWRLAGTTRTSDMLEISEEINSGAIDGARVMNAAGSCVLAAGERRLDVNTDRLEIEYAVKLAVGALVQTQCYQLAKDTPTGLNGHWLYLVYRMRDGSAIARPAMLTARSTPFALLDPEVLEGFVARIIQADTTTAASTIGRQLRASGGAIFPGDEVADEQERPKPLG